MDTRETAIERLAESQGARRLSRLLGVLLLVLLVWAAVGQLDIVSTAGGEIVPRGKVKAVQHLEGGIVREILVAEGATVEQGQPIVVLESTTSDSGVEELQVRMNALRVDMARLEAEVQGLAAPQFDQGLSTLCPDLVAQARDMFATRMTRLASEAASLEDRIKQRVQDVAESQAKLRSLRQNLELSNEQVSLSEELLKDNLTTRYEHLSYLKEQNKLASAVEEEQAALSRAESALSQAREDARRLRHAFQEEAQGKLKEVSGELDGLNQRMRRVADSLLRTTLRSPVRGTVKALHVTTVGGVVTPGMAVADIVPVGGQLLVEAKLPVSDVGYVHEGQTAVIKLASMDARRFGSLRGRVATVSPDSFVNQDGRAFYSVQIETEKDCFEGSGGRYTLYPGMQVMAYIHTGQRTVLQYLFDPFLDSLGSALQER
ncbi:HlyD family type I secretion periplasmic adaptor subunit [Desulfocurvibacter africanus]|uniref:HlyD family type I secretion periplasmic adaptor subunit n=1 Tax=Desulfocurvibacter africanus TaxID=873 RepID=UPI002FDAF039